MTPCEKIGLKKGGKCEVVDDTGHHYVGKGDIITLASDDGTRQPWFSCPDGEEHIVSISRIKPLKEKPMEPSMQDWYLQGHKACGIEAGDKVKVLRAAKNYEMGWGTVWNSSMNEQIGEVLTVRGDRGGNGFLMEGGYSYPFFVLEFIEKGEKPIRIGGHTVEFKDNGIQVGRTFVNKEIVKEIAKRLEK